MAAKLVSSPRIDERFAFFKLEIRESKIHRYGLYALEAIPANRKVMEYTGERISRRETKRRSHRKLTYLFQLNSYWTIDGAVGGSGAEIANHSCEPNLRSRIQRERIFYLSKRAILAGEELTVDYYFSDDEQSVKCCCGAPSCRGAINY
ncbi:MAG TPA: SET domain-containing protein-lysine N-methyltransferase [Bryobacteraceae bacterium]|jgi:SET domain-containing protein|nr:SET domain-containing protein-lysine N-methyltransferase [Bryobacteraceae bacterium]